MDKKGSDTFNLENDSRDCKSPVLSDEIKKKLEWFDYYEKSGKNARLTCRHFGISPDTFYRWKKRYDPKNLSTLEDNKKNRRPKKLREPTTPQWVINRVKELKESYPFWTRKQISIQIKNEGLSISLATVGRIVKRLKESGLLQESATYGERKKTIPYDYQIPTGYHEYLSLIQLWGRYT